MTKVVLAKSDEDIAACFEAFVELRTYLKNVNEFVAQVKRQQRAA